MPSPDGTGAATADPVGEDRGDGQAADPVAAMCPTPRMAPFLDRRVTEEDAGAARFIPARRPRAVHCRTP